MFETLDIFVSGLQAQRTRMDTIAANIANLDSALVVPKGSIAPKDHQPTYTIERLADITLSPHRVSTTPTVRAARYAPAAVLRG